MLAASGDEQPELLDVVLGNAPFGLQHFNAYYLLSGVEIDHDAGLHFLGLGHLRVVQAKVQRVHLFVVADSHVLPRSRRSK